MTTLSKAIKLADQGEEYQIAAQVVSKQIFSIRRDGEVCKLLTIGLIDQLGNYFELKTWSELKAFTVIRKFALDTKVLVTASGPMRAPNAKYSRATADIYGNWWMEPYNNFKKPVGIRCFSQISKYRKFQSKPANIVGTFVDLSENGPSRKTSSGYVLAQGHFLRLADEVGRIFRVLIWVSPNQKYNNRDILQAETGDLVLILAAREQDETYQPKNPACYTLTTTYPAIVNPDCLPHETTKILEASLDCDQKEYRV